MTQRYSLHNDTFEPAGFLLSWALTGPDGKVQARGRDRRTLQDITAGVGFHDFGIIDRLQANRPKGRELGIGVGPAALPQPQPATTSAKTWR